MKVSIFACADAVGLYGNRLMIMGVFDTLRIEKCPGVCKAFSIALRVTAEPKDYKKTHLGMLVLRKADSQDPIYKLPVKVNFKPHKSGQPPAALTIVANLSNIVLKRPGLYLWEFKVRGDVIGEILWSVEESGSP